MSTNHAHTPTTDTVREVYSFAGAQAPSVRKQWFDRWYQAEIAAAEQRGAERALRDAADHIENEIEFVLPNRHKPLRFRRSYEQDGTGLTPEEWLRARADRLEGDGGRN